MNLTTQTRKVANRTILASSAALTFLASLVLAPACRAQFVVYDPSNFSQNVLTAARTLQQINNQVQSLQNEAKMILDQGQMLVNQAKNLESLIYSPMAMLQQDLQRTQQLIAQAQGLATQVSQLDQQFSKQYPTGVWSRHLMEWVEVEPLWRFCPVFDRVQFI